MTDDPKSLGDDVRVAIVDDQALLRRSLATIVDQTPGFSIVAEAGTGDDAVKVAQKVRPDVVLMDIRMPGGDGLQATRRITADPTLRQVKILVLSMFELDEYVYAALRAGASGFLLKDTEPDQLTDAIRRTSQGESLFAPTILTRLVTHYLDSPPQPSTPVVEMLTPRETEVLRVVGQGLSNTEIAEALDISVKTVKTHIGNLLAKLGARDRVHLVIEAYKTRLVSPR